LAFLEPVVGVRIVPVPRDLRVSAGRSKDAITAMFNGVGLVGPGVMRISYWRPDGGVPAPDADKVWGYAGVARTL
jgi:S-adenosyl methyltransferase